MYPNELFAPLSFTDDLANSRRGDLAAKMRVGYGYLTGASGVGSVRMAREQFSTVAQSYVGAAAWLAYLDATDPHATDSLRADGRQRLSQYARSADPMAQTLLGKVCLRASPNSLPDVARAKVLFADSARHFLLALTGLGRVFLREGNKKEGLRLLRQASEGGEVCAVNSLADLFLAMKSKSATAEAKRLLRTGVRRHNVRSRYLTGVIYYHEGIAGDAQQLGRAFRLFKGAAVTQYPLAQAALGLCLTTGSGTDRDERAGQDWLKGASRSVSLVAAQLGIAVRA